MSNTNTIQAGAPANSTKMLRAMVGIGILCALMIVLTYEGTKPIIEENKAEALERAIFKVIPGMVSKKNFVYRENEGFVPVEDGAEVEGKIVYAGYDANDQLAGIALEASGMGFADILRILYGYDPEKEQIVGFYVLESKETPGLGDKIEKDPDFLANFEALDVSLATDEESLKNQVVPVKSGEKDDPWEVDGITGATISSKAIGNIIGASTQEWVPLLYQHKDDFKIQNSQTEKVIQ